MAVSVTLGRTGPATWGLTFNRDGHVFAVGTAERAGNIYSVYASPDERRGCELVGSGTDLEAAVTTAMHFFVAGLHHPTARHYAEPAGQEGDEDLTAVEWTT
ncbi:hypothetical protein [Streptacidiphilus neutrinimicus]|uniref:hypothetical protein n=1 Tax=Streptacidiphilus neutrinimicus TaxID=105420 RepID=UPI0005A8110B|nr:hypothetical protein [Streptacidiphilus neutrinimicus]